MFSKMKEAPLPVRIMLSLLLLATISFSMMGLELARTPFYGWSVGFAPAVCDMAFLAALFSACGIVGWMYAADLVVTLKRGYGVFAVGNEWPACED